MAEQSASEKTEDPTPWRLKKAREEGQIPQGKEAPTALVLLILLAALSLSADRLFRWFAGAVTNGVTFFGAPRVDGPHLIELLGGSISSAMWAVLPLGVALMVASALSSLVSSGWSLAPVAIKPKIDRIDPVRGFKNLFSLKSLVNLLVSMSKMALILILVYTFLRNRLDQIVALRWASTSAILSETAGLVFGVAGRITIGLLAIALLDTLYQRYNWKKQLRMTKQEVKEEFKQFELSPEVKGRIRSLQMEMSRKRMLEDVPEADVIVTNPTHVAVALKYDASSMAAPEVLAKGADHMAGRIREIAEEHQVPIVRRPPLARTLYATVKIGEPVPETLFVAVAEVLAMIYRLRRQRAQASRAGSSL